MAYDQALIERVREALAGKEDVEEHKMFGGYFFLINGKMCACVRGDELMVKIDHKDYEAALREPGTRSMIKHDRPIIGSVFIESSQLADEMAFQKWIDRALKHNTTTQAK
jgi:TfoX/Sxy family transcriptional regulator of competence genes